VLERRPVADRAADRLLPTTNVVTAVEPPIAGTESVRFTRTAALINVKYDQSAGKSISGDRKREDSPALRAETFAITLGYSEGSWSVVRLQAVE
jgi:hypothetical protein